MKESEIQKISIDKIFSQLGLALQPYEVKIIIKEKNKNKGKLCDEFDENLPNDRAKKYRDYVLGFLKKHESDIDKTALVILMLNNYIETINMQEIIVNSNEEGIKQIKQYITKAKEILKGVDRKVYKIIEHDDKTMHIHTISAKNLTEGTEDKNNSKKLEELEEQGLPLEKIINSLILTDLEAVVCDNGLGDSIRGQAFYNTAIKKGIDPDRILNGNYLAEEINDGLTFEELLPEIEDAVYENIDNMDLDKLVLCSAYRYIEYLENFVDSQTEENNAEIINRLQLICNYLEGKSTKLEGRIEKNQNGDPSKECEYINISYRVKDLKKDMEKFDGKTYWGKATVENTKRKLTEGSILLQDVNMTRVKLTAEEITKTAIVNDENYRYLIANGFLKLEQVAKINQGKTILSKECLKLLLEKKMIIPEDLIESYMKEQITIEDIMSLNIDLNNALTLERIYEEYNTKDNLIGQEKMSILYKKIVLFDKDDEELEENKQKVFDKYLETMDCGYLETFLGLGALTYEDLKGIMDSKEWLKSYEDGQISADFLLRLQEHKLINPTDISSNKNILEQELQLWEQGNIPTEQIRNFGISIEMLLELCDKGIIKGTKIGELIPENEQKKYANKIESSYTYGIYETIRPLIAEYNSDVLSRDKTIEIIKAMKTKSGEITKLCEEGLLSGYKIAEFRYKGLISKNQFAKLKELGRVSDEEEIEVANNLTPEEMIKELEENGCKKIENIYAILEELSKRKRKTNHENDVEPSMSSDKKIINPIKRNEIFEILGTDTIVTTPENGFKGYQAYLIPQLGIAILEKLFRKNRQGEIKPDYGDATYICEIGKYIQVSGQSKREIRDFMNVEGKSNGNVEIISHTNGWGINLVEAISKVNPQITVKKNKGKDKIESMNRGEEELYIDYQALNTIISFIKKGELSISMEEYE